MDCAGLFDEETCKRIPNCSYRKYTVSGAINSMIGSGFILKRSDKHPPWQDAHLSGVFTAQAKNSLQYLWKRNAKCCILRVCRYSARLGIVETDRQDCRLICRGGYIWRWRRNKSRGNCFPMRKRISGSSSSRRLFSRHFWIRELFRRNSMIRVSAT